MSTDTETAFQALLREAEGDEHVLGSFLGGSRGKGYHHPQSDYDVTIVVADDVAHEYGRRLGAAHVPGMDVRVRSLSEFRGYAAWLSEAHWDRYDFTHVRALVDRTGEIQRLIDEKGSVPAAGRDGFIQAQLDGYLNAFFRSVKCVATADAVGMRLEAAASLPHLLNALFALHGRATPFPGYLVRELARVPLDRWPWTTGTLIECLLTILGGGDLRTQQELARTVERVFRGAGYDQVFDAWAWKDRWAMQFQPAGERVPEPDGGGASSIIRHDA